MHGSDIVPYSAFSRLTAADKPEEFTAGCCQSTDIRHTSFSIQMVDEQKVF